MKATAKIAALTAAFTTCASSAFAAGSAASGGGFLLWIFLGFFGLIIATQLVPALMLMVGIAKGVAGTSEATQPSK